MRSIEQLKKDVCAAIDAQRERIIGIGETVWKNPESGYREVKTSKLAKETLESLGLKVRDSLALTGLRADLGGASAGPTLAILGEMDALVLPTHPEADPVTGAVHACGHNCHITGLLGAAIGLCGAGAAEELAGKIAFIAAPAEECIELDYRLGLVEKGLIQFMSGKQELIRCGAFDDVDMAYMLHVGDGYCIWNGNGFLVKRITFHGKSCHAAGPQGGVNAMSAMTLAQTAIGLLRERMDDRARVHGIITAGGDVTNIIPDVAEMEYMVRADSIEKLKKLNEMFDCAVSHSAQALGAAVKIRTMPGDMPLKNDMELVKLYKDVMRELIPDAEIPDLSFIPGSTDMGDVCSVMPAFHGAVKGTHGCHSIDYKIVDPELAYVGNAKIMALMAVELLYGDAARGKKIAEAKAGKLSIPEYLATLKEMCC